MSSKRPSFPFYVQDFLMGVRYFDAAEVGAYILLLCEQWDAGFIENNPKILKKISRISAKKLQKVLEKFDLVDGKKYINSRLEQERIKKAEFLGRSSEGGKKSAEKRWGKPVRVVTDSLPDGLPISLPEKNNISFSSSISSTTDVVEKKPILITELFITNFFTYHKKVIAGMAHERKLTYEVTEQLAKQFLTEKKNLEIEYEDFNDVKSHMNSWLRKYLELNPQERAPAVENRKREPFKPSFK